MQLSRREKNLAAIALILIMFMIYYYIVLMPSMTEIAQLKNQISVLNTTAVKVPDIDVEQYKQKLFNKGGILTTYIDNPLLLKHIGSIMAAHQASLLTISVSPSTDNANKKYDFITINLEAEMSKSDVISFVKDIESSIPYVYIVESLHSYMPKQGDTDKQRVSMAIKIYYSSEYGVDDVR